MKIDYKELLKFYRGKKVLITGNTGFKGSWLTHILLSAGADVTGYALRPSTKSNLFDILGLDRNVFLHQYYADVRDLEKLITVFKETTPEIVFHLAAQPIVRDSFRDPVTTYGTNVMGTVNVCEAIRLSRVPMSAGGIQRNGEDGVVSFLNVTTDKVYKNVEWEWGYRETDILGGIDPYSNSKSCSELVTHCYKDAFFKDNTVKMSTARAGNVIGGGDFSNDRIIPDCVRAIISARDEEKNNGTIVVRNPQSTRPYEHVLEPLFAYLLIAAKQYEDASFSGYYNIGPDDNDCVSTGELVDLFSNIWNEGSSSIRIERFDKTEEHAVQEAKFLKLDCSRLKSTFNWKPTWNIKTALSETIAWTRIWLEGADAAMLCAEMDREIEEFVINNISKNCGQK